jgi:tetratricopeptide (TPR) repeat protein
MKKSIIFLVLCAALAGCTPAPTVKKDKAEAEPSECKKHYDIAHQYLQMKMYDDAIVNFQGAISCSSDYVDAYLGLATSYSEKREYGLSEETYKSLTDAVPESITGWTGLGALYAKLSRYEEAMSAYNAAQSIDSSDASIYHGMGFVHDQQKDLDSAVQLYRKAVNLDPTEETYIYALANALHKRGNIIEAIQILEDLARDFPKNIDAKIKLADAYLDNEQYAQALELYAIIEKALENIATINMKKGKCCEKLQQYSDAEAEYLRAIEKSSNKLIPYQHLINMQLRMGNHGKAHTYIKEARKLFPADAGLSFMMGDVFIGYGDASRSKGGSENLKAAIASYKTAKSWYNKAQDDEQWGPYVAAAIKLANAKIKNTEYELFYGD